MVGTSNQSVPEMASDIDKLLGYSFNIAMEAIPYTWRIMELQKAGQIIYELAMAFMAIKNQRFFL